MASSSSEQELLPEQTEGFKVGEKKTMDEYHKLGMFLFRCCSKLIRVLLVLLEFGLHICSSIASSIDFLYQLAFDVPHCGVTGG
jgi:hypothetical protein